MGSIKDFLAHKIKEAAELNMEELEEIIGLRMDTIEYDVGDKLKKSKEFLDQREFPIFGSDEYDKLEDLEGTSAWMCGYSEGELDEDEMYDKIDDLIDNDELNNDYFWTIIGGNDLGTGNDEDEIIIGNASVLVVI